MRIDLFCEDRAHEELLLGLLRRLAVQEGVEVGISVRSARGGHPRVFMELRLYQGIVAACGWPAPDLLVVAIDTNCDSYAATRKAIEETLDLRRFPHLAVACPNPHVELWYLADPDAFERVVGVRPPLASPECGKQSRNTLKKALSDSVRAAGHPVLFGGVQFAQELAEAFDLFVVGKADAGFRHFVHHVVGQLRQLQSSTRSGEGTAGSSE